MKLASGLCLGLVTVLLGSLVACSSDEDPPPGVDGSSGGTSSSSGGTSSGAEGSSGAASSSGGESSSGTGSSSGGSSGSTSSSSGAVEVSLQAIVTTLRLAQEVGNCSVDLELPLVDAPSDTAETLIRESFPTTVADYCEHAVESYTGRYTVATNAWGVLSIALQQKEKSQLGATPRPLDSWHNFDIATGDSIVFETMLDAAGVDLARAKCVSTMPLSPGLTQEEIDEMCSAAIQENRFHIEAAGLQILAPFRDGANIPARLSWAELGASVILPVVQNFASKQQP